MSDLTERAYQVAEEQVRLRILRGPSRPGHVRAATERLTQMLIDLAAAVQALDAAGPNPDAEDPSIDEAWSLVQAWTDKSDRALARAAALGDTAADDYEHSALMRQARTASDCATALRRVLCGDPDTTGDNRE